MGPEIITESRKASPDLIDIGANLTHDSFADDFDDILARAEQAGVRRMIVTGASEQGSIDAAKLAAGHPGRFYATAGMHPHHADDYTDSVHQTIAELITQDCVVAVGECGLDFFRNFSAPAAQRKAFEKQLELASESKLPVFLHQRDAHEDFMAVLAPVYDDLSRGVAHCFTGTANELEDYISLGLYIGITGWICDERRGAHLLDIIKMIPDDRLMIETDAPYLLPRTLRPKPKSRRNEPGYLPEVLRVVSQALERSETEIAKITTANAERFFEIQVSAE